MHSKMLVIFTSFWKVLAGQRSEISPSLPLLETYDEGNRKGKSE